LNRADADETIFIVAMLSVMDFEVVVIAGEQLLRLVESNPVLLAVDPVLLRFPFEVHLHSLI
jgi:hypothetical protein